MFRISGSFLEAQNFENVYEGKVRKVRGFAGGSTFTCFAADTHIHELISVTDLERLENCWRP